MYRCLATAAAGAALTLFLAFGFTISTAALTVGTVVIPPELRGVYVATTMVAGSVCFGLAPLLVSSLSSVLGGSTVIGQALALVCGVTSGIGALVFGFGSRRFSSSADQFDLTDT